MRSSVGPSPQLSLRVSAATLSRIIFPHPIDSSLQLALEHKAMVLPSGDEPIVSVKAQPFGGAARILKPESLQKLVGAFSYDSERSRSERDFRIFINPSNWDSLLDFCRRASKPNLDAGIDHNPSRELVEEFSDALGVELAPIDYMIERVGLVVESDPLPTSNPRAPDHPTARVYWIDEVRIKNRELCLLMTKAGQSQDKLRERAIEDFKRGGPGRANAVFTAPLEKIAALYLEMDPEERSKPLELEGVVLSSNVPAIMREVDTAHFQRIG